MRRKAGTHQECKPAKGSGNDGAKGIHGNGEDQQGERWEFGGPRGCLGIMMFSVCICYWLWLSCVLRDGRPLLPYAPITDFVAEVYEALVRESSRRGNWGVALPCPATLLSHCPA